LNDIVFADGPVAGGGLDEGKRRVGEDVEAEGVGGADGRTFFGPPFAGAAFDVDVAGGLQVEEVVRNLK